tara:strand:+ start:598 stop:729 length:132 start_codon:yes stop_codon:yes gene_type:complete
MQIFNKNINKDILREIEDLLGGHTDWQRDELLDQIQQIIDKHL